MPLTYTGRLVKPDNAVHPSLIDIAIGLSRQPRFAGQTRRWWSVLDHTLFGDELVKAGDEYGTGCVNLRLAWLLHDAHEAITADVPTTFKPSELRCSQHTLDGHIAGAFFPGGYVEFLAWAPDVKDIDARCLLAEASLVGPPAAMDHLPAFGFKPEGQELLFADQRILNRQIGRGAYLGIPPVTFPSYPLEHPGVTEYLRRMLELL